MNKTTIKLLVTVTIIAGGIGFLINSSMSSAQYYKMVDELMVAPDDWVGKTMRVHGFVEAGSIDEQIVDKKTLRTFTLEHKGHSIVVTHEGPKPDTFKDRSEVVAKGRLIRDGGEVKLVADELMAKCPSKYEGADKNRDLGERKKVF